MRHLAANGAEQGCRTAVQVWFARGRVLGRDQAGRPTPSHQRHAGVAAEGHTVENIACKNRRDGKLKNI